MLDNPLLLAILLFFSFILGPVPILLWLFRTITVIQKLESDVHSLEDVQLELQRDVRKLRAMVEEPVWLEE